MIGAVENCRAKSRPAPSETNSLVWQWRVSKDKAKDYDKKDLVLDGTTLNLPTGIDGDHNIWADKHH